MFLHRRAAHAGKAWLFEFNMTPALCQHTFAMEDDETMMRDALSIAMPWAGSNRKCGLTVHLFICALTIPIETLPTKVERVSAE